MIVRYTNPRVNTDINCIELAENTFDSLQPSI